MNSNNLLYYLAESPKDASNKDSPASQSSVADSGVFSIQSNSPSKGDGTTSGTSPDSPNARYPDQQAFNSRDGHGPQCKSSPFRNRIPAKRCTTTQCTMHNLFQGNLGTAPLPLVGLPAVLRVTLMPPASNSSNGNISFRTLPVPHHKRNSQRVPQFQLPRHPPRLQIPARTRQLL